MSQTLKLNNFGETNVLEVTNLGSDLLAGVTELPVLNSQDYIAGDFIILGTLGTEASELLVVDGTTDGAITVADATIRNHFNNEPVTKLFGNQISLYRAQNVNNLQPDDTAFALVITVDIDTDQMATNVTDDANVSDVWYKYTFHNETTTLETDLASSNSGRTGNSGNYCSVQSIREEAGFKNNRYITDAKIDEKRQAAQGEVNGALSGRYIIPFKPVPPHIANIVRVLAAGYLLQSSYGTYTTADTNNGDSKVKWAQDELAKIASGQVVLQDAAGTPTNTPGAIGMRGWPNNTTALASRTEGGGDFKFRISDTDGYHDRQF